MVILLISMAIFALGCLTGITFAYLNFAKRIEVKSYENLSRAEHERFKQLLKKALEV